MIDPCEVAILSIDPTILSSLAISYDIGDALHAESLQDSLFIADPTPMATCPDILFSFDDQAGGAIDETIFSYDLVT